MGPQPEENKEGWYLLCNKYRFVILAMGVLCMTAIGCNYSVINFTFICMTEDANDTIVLANGTFRQRYDYSPTEKGFIIWSVAAGTFVGTFPINWLYIRYGARRPFFLCGCMSALATALSPYAASISLWVLCILRFLQGLAYSADFAAMGMIVVQWAPLGETATFIGFLTAFTMCAVIITNPISGYFCMTIGWRSAFYFFSAVTMFIFVLWVLLYKDDPDRHKGVSTKELKTIYKGKTDEHINRNSFVPYWEICTDKAILVMWFNSIAELTGMIVLLTYAPIYINKVLGYSIKQTAFWATLGAALCIPVKYACGIGSDKLKCLPEVHKMRLFNTLSVAASGVFCGMIGFMPPFWAAMCLSLSVGTMGMNVGGFLKCGTLHARQFGHFVLATLQYSKCIALLTGPAMVAIFVRTDSDAGGWITIFLIIAGIMLLANFLFMFVATDKPAEWTKITREVHHAAKLAKRNAVAPI